MYLPTYIHTHITCNDIFRSLHANVIACDVLVIGSCYTWNFKVEFLLFVLAGCFKAEKLNQNCLYNPLPNLLKGYREFSTTDFSAIG